jgi:hypothetical protein
MPFSPPRTHQVHDLLLVLVRKGILERLLAIRAGSNEDVLSCFTT